MARYFYRYQADPRRPVPTYGVWTGDGATALSLHPWEGIGPWFSYDRVQWHKEQLQGLRAAGVDVLLPVYSGSSQDRAGYALRGLDNLVQAMREMAADRQGGRERIPPRVGMYFDTAAMTRQYGSPPDLRREEVQRTFYGMIREFFLHVPPEFRAVLQRPDAPAADAGGVLVALGSASAFSDLDGSFARYCEQRFRRDFGLGIVWLAAADFQGKAPGLDAYLPAGAGRKAPDDPRAWARVARIRPGYDNTAILGATPTIESRLNGRAYIEAWLGALRGGADWVFLESWNHFGDGTAIAPTLEYGLQFADLTRAGAGQLRARAELGARIVSATVPREMARRALYQVEVVAQNAGLKGWGVANRVGLSYRWYRDGRPVGDPGPLVAAGDVAPGETKRLTLAVAAPIAGGEPLPDGEYELRVDMMLPGQTMAEPTAPPTQQPRRRRGQERRSLQPQGVPRPATGDARAASAQSPLPAAYWFSEAGSSAYRAAVRVGTPPPIRPTWLGSTLPGMVKTGESYSAIVRVRNDGSATWRKEDGVALGYRWRRVGVYLYNGPADRDELVAGEGLRSPLPTDVPPGATAAVPVTVRVLDADHKPLPMWNASMPWVYQIEWDFYDGKRWLGETGAEDAASADARRQTIQILEEDDGVEFLGSGLAAEVTRGGSVTTKLGIRNNGVEVWSPLKERVVYQWFYPDGSESVGPVEAARLPGEVRPGETVIVSDVAIRVPDTLGPMYLVFDLKRGDRLVSGAVNTRGMHLLVHPVNVVTAEVTERGATQVLPVSLAPFFNVDGISFDTNRADGDLDGEGHSFPGELLPPYVFRPGAGSPAISPTLYPSGLWVRPIAAQKDTERVFFRFPDKREGEKNGVACQGQRIAVPTAPRRAVHLLATATAGGTSGTVTFLYADGSRTEAVVSMSSWTEGPRHGEPIAFTCRHRHRPDGDEPGVRVHLYQYTLAPDPKKPLAAILLPQNPAMKVFAITLE